MPAEAGASQDMATLDVTVRLSAGGAVRAPRPVVTEVRVVPVGGDPAQPSTRTCTGPDGTASITLPSGQYWVVVPAATGEERRSVAQTRLPNGLPVSGWAAVDLAPGEQQAITITLANLAP